MSEIIKIGILAPIDFFSQELIKTINYKNDRFRAEFCKVDALRLNLENPYKLILDRNSHYIEYYQAYLKNAYLQGTCIINNPFLFLSDDKFYNYTLASKLKIAVPKTICLPSKAYPLEIKEKDLHNLIYPLNWEKIVDYIGFPAILKPYDGYGWLNVYKVNNFEELMQTYNQSGDQVMLLQEYIDSQNYFRTFVIGKKYVLPITYDPYERRCIFNRQNLSSELEEKITKETQLINRALGYDFNVVEFAIRDGVPYAIDFMNPVPEVKIENLPQEYFYWVIEHLIKIIFEYLKDENLNYSNLKILAKN